MYFTPETTVYLNGQFVKSKEATAGLYSQTMHYGNGVFEGIRSYSTAEGFAIFKLEEHLHRLKFSAEKMHIPFQFDLNELYKACYQLLKKNDLKNAYIRPLVYLGPNMSFRHIAKANIFIGAWQWGKLLGEEPLRVMISSYCRPNPKAFHIDAKVVGHYVNSALAVNEAGANGYDEALLLDENGFVAQGPAGNFFFEKDGVLYTAPKDQIFPGITRNTVIDLAKSNKIEVVEKLFTVKDIEGADAAFFTGTAVEVAPVKEIGEIIIDKDWEDSKSYDIACQYRQLVREQIDHHTVTFI